MRTLSGDHERFETTYFKVYSGYYFTGDGCRRDKDGYYWLIGQCPHLLTLLSFQPHRAMPHATAAMLYSYLQALWESE